MASGDSGDSPRNAAMEGEGAMARKYFMPHVLSICGDGFPVQLGNGEGVWGGDGQEIFLFIKYCWKAPFWSLIFLQKPYCMLNIGCNYHSTLGSRAVSL